MEGEEEEEVEWSDRGSLGVWIWKFESPDYATKSFQLINFWMVPGRGDWNRVIHMSASGGSNKWTKLACN